MLSHFCELRRIALNEMPERFLQDARRDRFKNLSVILKALIDCNITKQYSLAEESTARYKARIY